MASKAIEHIRKHITDECETVAGLKDLQASQHVDSFDAEFAACDAHTVLYELLTRKGKPNKAIVRIVLEVLATIDPAGAAAAKLCGFYRVHAHPVIVGYLRTFAGHDDVTRAALRTIYMIWAIADPIDFDIAHYTPFCDKPETAAIACKVIALRKTVNNDVTDAFTRALTATTTAARRDISAMVKAGMTVETARTLKAANRAAHRDIVATIPKVSQRCGQFIRTDAFVSAMLDGTTFHIGHADTAATVAALAISGKDTAMLQKRQTLDDLMDLIHNHAEEEWAYTCLTTFGAKTVERPRGNKNPTCHYPLRMRAHVFSRMRFPDGSIRCLPDAVAKNIASFLSPDDDMAALVARVVKHNAARTDIDDTLSVVKAHSMPGSFVETVTDIVKHHDTRMNVPPPPVAGISPTNLLATRNEQAAGVLTPWFGLARQYVEFAHKGALEQLMTTLRVALGHFYQEGLELSDEFSCIVDNLDISDITLPVRDTLMDIAIVCPDEDYTPSIYQKLYTWCRKQISRIYGVATQAMITAILRDIEDHRGSISLLGILVKYSSTACNQSIYCGGLPHIVNGLRTGTDTNWYYMLSCMSHKGRTSACDGLRAVGAPAAAVDGLRHRIVAGHGTEFIARNILRYMEMDTLATSFLVAAGLEQACKSAQIGPNIAQILKLLEPPPPAPISKKRKRANVDRFSP